MKTQNEAKKFGILFSLFLGVLLVSCGGNKLVDQALDRDEEFLNKVEQLADKEVSTGGVFYLEKNFKYLYSKKGNTRQQTVCLHLCDMAAKVCKTWRPIFYSFLSK